MELRIYSQELDPIGIVDEMVTLIWQTKYWDVGSFSILAPVTDKNLSLLKKGNIIIKHDGKQEVTDEDGDTWRRAAQINYRHIAMDTNGEEQLEIKGSFIGKWLNKRIVASQLVTTDTNQNIINEHVEKNCGENASDKRKFPQFQMIEQEDLGGSSIEYSNESYVDLGVEVKTRAQVGKLGYDILVNERSKIYGFYLYKGNDLTSSNTDGNTPCIFSRDFDNISSQEYEESDENYKNYVYIAGEVDEDTSISYTTEVDAEDATGYDLEEVYCDASDIARTYEDEDGDEQTIPLATYIELLKTRGSTELDTYVEVLNFDSVINTASNMTYKEDFWVGDKITNIDKQWGIKVDIRITEIMETYQNGKEEIEVTFGDSFPTLLEKIRKVR